jgi:hypothetical protein
MAFIAGPRAGNGGRCGPVVRRLVRADDGSFRYSSNSTVDSS